MLDLLALEKSFIAPHIKAGGAVADFTMGNGHDTLWLSRAVGETGTVWAFDIQNAAVESTRAFLRKNDAPENYTLILDSHANAEKYIDRKLCAAVFNLGYLPGGDKSITTLRESTRPAVEAAIRLLDRDGILLIAVYPGHAEGSLEGKMLEEMLSPLDRTKFCIGCFKLLNSPTSPFFIFVEKG